MTKGKDTVTSKNRAKILDLQGNVLNPDPPIGFYAVEVCPMCGAPLFYHGGGEHIQDHPAGPSTIHPVPEQVFTVCDCPTQQVAINVPSEYNLLAERQAISMLMGAYNKLRHLNDELAQTLQELLAEPTEPETVYDESNEWVVETRVRDTGPG